MENKAIEVGILSCGSEISERFMKNCFDERSLADPLKAEMRPALETSLWSLLVGHLPCAEGSGRERRPWETASYWAHGTL